MLSRHLLTIRPARTRPWPSARSLAASSQQELCRPMICHNIKAAEGRLQPILLRTRPRPFSTAPPRRYYDPNDPRLRSARPVVTTGQLRRVIRSPSTHAVIVIAIASAIAFYFLNMEVVPVSGRKRFNCFGEESVNQVSEMQYKRVIYEVESQGGRFLSDWDWRTIMVKRVMKRLIPVSGMEGENWEVMVIDDPRTANAFVLPGGKVFVFSGIFNMVKNESAMAAVLGHEIAHNLAGHISERLSQSIGVNILWGSLLFLSLAIPGGIFAVQFFGRGFLDILFERPMGRLQESEADYIGLMMMAEACYDPRDAVDFWARMDRAQQGEPPEWLSTHPSNRNRVEKIQSWLPKAIEKREESDCQGTQGFAELFKRAMRQGIVISE